MAVRHSRKAVVRSTLAIALSLFALGLTRAGSVSVATRDRASGYFVVDLPSLAQGTVSEGRHVNSQGVVSGLSHLSTGERRATVWIDRVPHDLGTLGGPHSAVVFTDFTNGQAIVGIAETGDPDPRNEAFSCSEFFPGGRPGRTGLACRGFVIPPGGAMTPLETLGGAHSFAAGSNNQGRVVGWAQTTFEDPGCVGDAVLQFLPVVWDGASGRVLATLPTIPGDSSGSALAINDNGQVVGISGDCDQAVGRHSARHAVIWENGAPAPMGDLGADTWNTPLSINHRGEVVGFAGIPNGDQPVENFGAFYWTKEGGIVALQNLGADTHSEAWAINERGQAVGVSCGDVCSAVLWEGRVPVDLNGLVQPGYRGHLRTARHINDRGVITGQSVDPDTRERRAYIAIPLP